MKKPTLWIVGILLAGLAGTGHAETQTLNGTVRSVDTGGNALTLVSQAQPAGETTEYKLVWEDSLPDLQALENARIGQNLTVQADQNPITRNWKVLGVSGPIDQAKDALRGDERLLSGEIRQIDVEANTLLLASKDMDADGKAMEYRVVWDDSNPDVRDKIERKKIGDNISVKADQNVITRNWKANEIAGVMDKIGESDLRMLSGEIKEINPEKNYLLLTTTDEKGQQVERKVVWDKNFRDQARLENAHIGERLSVRADQNMITRNWRVQSLG